MSQNHVSCDADACRKSSDTDSCLKGTKTCLEIISCLLCCFTLFAPAHGLERMELAYTWGTVDFNFHNDTLREEVIASGDYALGYSVPFDVDVYPEDSRRFFAFPNLFPQSYVSLATLPSNASMNSPVMEPYPDISWHSGERGCEGLTSVFRMQIDPCGRLWVIDNGRVEIASAFRAQCPPQIFVFNLTDDSLILRHRFDSSIVDCDDSLMLNIVTERPNNDCSDDAFAYIADATAFQLFVFSLRANRSWTVQSDFFYPDPDSRDFYMMHKRFTLMDGLTGLAVTPSQMSGHHYLYFNPITSYREGRVRTAILRNESLFVEGNSVPEEFYFIGSRSSQIIPQATSSTGALFFSYINQFSINCWNSRLPYSDDWIYRVEFDPFLIRFVTGMKVIPFSIGEEVWALANNGEHVFTGTYEPNVTNSINVFHARVDYLTSGTNCAFTF